MSNTIYIAGKITGEPNYRKKFQKAEDRLKSKGYIVLNPAILPEGMPWDAYMPICFAMIDAAKAVFLLKDFTLSKGA